MIKAIREDVDYLLRAPVDEYDVFDALQAINLLAEADDDLAFQLSVPRESFQGHDYDSWKTKASYKHNKIKSARRRFSAHYRRIQEETELNLLKSLCISLINGNEGALTAIKNMVM